MTALWQTGDEILRAVVTKHHDQFVELINSHPKMVFLRWEI